VSHDDLAILTPYGVFCLSCVPKDLEDDDLFAVYDDEQLDAYPVCERCGRKHDYTNLTPRGERFELEVRGPRPDDVMLTECGPADKLLELSIVDDRVVAVFAPSRLSDLASLVKRHRDAHPDAAVWVTRQHGAVELASPSVYDPHHRPDSPYVNLQG